MTFQQRTQTGTTDPTALASTETFEDLYSMAGVLESANYSGSLGAFISGVNTGDTITHEAYFPFEETLFELGIDKLFIYVEYSTRGRRFKVKGIEPYGAGNKWLKVSLVEKGFADKEATKA